MCVCNLRNICLYMYLLFCVVNQIHEDVRDVCYFISQYSSELSHIFKVLLMY